MGKKRTDCEFKEEISNLNDNIIITGIFTKVRDRIDVACKICNHKWTPFARKLLEGQGCPKCYGNVKKTHTEFSEELYNKTSNIILIGKYAGANKKIKVSSSKCKHEWNASANHLLEGQGCPKCHKMSLKSIDQFIKDVDNPSIKITGEYKGLRNKIDAHCLKCGHDWKPFASKLYQGGGCPACKENIGERQTRQLLKTLNIEFNSQHDFEGLIHKRQLHVDFYIPLLNIAIEVDGAQHRKPVKYFGGEGRFKQQQIQDGLKNDYCENNGIQLIRLEYDGTKIPSFQSELDRLSLLLNKSRNSQSSTKQ